MKCKKCNKDYSSDDDFSEEGICSDCWGKLTPWEQLEVKKPNMYEDVIEKYFDLTEKGHDSKSAARLAAQKAILGSSEADKKRGNCFIATAAFRDPFAQEIQFLYNFRDSFLLKKSFGRTLVKEYYRFSPYVARLIDRHPLLCNITRLSLKAFISVIKK